MNGNLRSKNWSAHNREPKVVVRRSAKSAPFEPDSFTAAELARAALRKALRSNSLNQRAAVDARGVAALNLLPRYHRIDQPKSKHEQSNYDHRSEAIHLHSVLELIAVFVLGGDRS
jgi:hypothetical protein